MDYHFNRSIPGKLVTRLVGVVEVIIESALIIWFIGDVAINGGKYSTNSGWVNDSRNLVTKVLVGVYFFLGLIMSILLVYSTFAAPSLTTRKRIATSWCVFRGLSFLGAMGFIVHNRGSFDNLFYVVMAGFLVMWALFIYIVSLYLGGLDAEIARETPPKFRKRKVSSVSAFTDDNGGDIENPEQQIQQFRAYLHRPSWQSAISITDYDDRYKGNSLAVPECRF